MSIGTDKGGFMKSIGFSTPKPFTCECSIVEAEELKKNLLNPSHFCDYFLLRDKDHTFQDKE